jgi:NADH-quinone oxidoreductase subunit I
MGRDAVKDENKNRERPLNLTERFYFVEALRGLGITAGHFFRNLFVHTARALGLAQGKKGAVTIQYPEERRPIPPGYRALHRLVLREDGSPKCVACMMCPTICPAQCIHIRAGESPDPTIEKYPVEFNIVLDRCVMCGLCVEACPVDAIRMDTGVVEMSAYDRKDFLNPREVLMGRKEAETP